MGHFNAGVSLQRVGRIDEAIRKYRLALSLDPDLAPARDNLGIVLAMRGEFPDAISEGLRAVALEPRNAAMRGNLASSYYASGDIEGAIREFRKAVELAPGNPRARTGLAMSYRALGRHREAAQELENAKTDGVRIEAAAARGAGATRLSGPPGKLTLHFVTQNGVLRSGKRYGNRIDLKRISGSVNI